MAGVGGGFHVVACATSQPHLRGCFVALPKEYARQLSGASGDGGITTLKLEWAPAGGGDDGAADEGEARRGPGPEREMKRSVVYSATRPPASPPAHPPTHQPTPSPSWVGPARSVAEAVVWG